MDLMAQLVARPVFTQETLDEERRVVLNEFDRDQSTRSTVCSCTSSSNSGPPVGAARTSSAKLKAINDASLKVAARHLSPVLHTEQRGPDRERRRNGRPGRERGAAAFRRDGGAARIHLRPIRYPRLRHSHAARPVTLEDDVRNVTVRIEWQGPALPRISKTPTRRTSWDPWSTRRARIFHRHLVDSGLFTSVNPVVSDAGSCRADHAVRDDVTDSLPRALPALARELAELDDRNAFSTDELTNSKRSRAVDAAFELDYPTEMAHTVGYWWSVLGLGYYMDYTTRMAAVTRADLRRYVDRYIHRAPAVVGLLVPRGDHTAVQAPVTAFLSQLSGAAVSRTGSP